jgi:hypothetical protein
MVVILSHQESFLGISNSAFSDDCQSFMDTEFPNSGVSIVECKKSQLSEGISSVASEGEVPIECDISFSQSVSSQQEGDRNVSTLEIILISFLLFACGFVEGPSFSGVINRQDKFAVPGEHMQHRWQSLTNGEVAIESFDVVFILIEAIAVKDT